MLKAFSEVKTKYILLRDEESLKKQLNSLISYMEFITSLNNILKKEKDYIFFISDKKEFLASTIMNQTLIDLDLIKEKEEYVLTSLLELEKFTKEELKFEKIIYQNQKIEALNQPLFNKNYDYSSIIKSNYLNLRKLKRIERTGSEKTKKSLENDKTFLYLINSLINEYPEVLDRSLIQFIKTTMEKSNVEEFDTFKDFVHYEIYKTTTLINMSKIKKVKTKRKTL